MAAGKTNTLSATGVSGYGDGCTVKNSMEYGLLESAKPLCQRPNPSKHELVDFRATEDSTCRSIIERTLQVGDAQRKPHSVGESKVLQFVTAKAIRLSYPTHGRIWQPNKQQSMIGYNNMFNAALLMHEF